MKNLYPLDDLSDSHTHLHLTFNQENKFKTEEQIAQSLKAQGISKIINVFEGSDDYFLMETFEKIKNKTSIKIYFAGGVHPLRVRDISKENTELFLKKYSDKFIAFGETGIDLFKDTNREQQMEYLDIHGKMCEIHKKPIVIHARHCDINDIFNVLKPYKIKIMFHCWTFGPEELEIALQYNTMISFPGIVTFDKSQQIVESAKLCPLDRMLVETDAPYLSPVPFRGKQNEVSYIEYTYRYIANLKNMDPQEFATAISQNFDNFFL